MSWQLLITISVVLYSISVILQRLILKENESQPIAYSIFFQFLTGMLIGIIGFLFADMSLPTNLKSLLLNLVLATFLYGFSNVFIFKSLKQTEASKFTIIFATRAFFTTLASSLILKEFLVGEQWLGTLFIFLGVILVNLKSSKFQFGKGEILALFGAITFGLANTNDRFLLQSFQVYPYVAIGFIAPSFLMSAIYPKELKYIKLFLNKKILKKVLVLSVIYAFSAITFFAALQTSSNSSQVASVNLTSVIITVILSMIILKERDNFPQKIVGAILTFVGLLLLA
ncbi:DMT family transporter, partial [Patescibacteria group bacterium]|nr:DMT family transporter [Patescibacteria group bacterium]